MKQVTQSEFNKEIPPIEDNLKYYVLSHNKLLIKNTSEEEVGLIENGKYFLKEKI